MFLPNFDGLLGSVVSGRNLAILSALTFAVYLLLRLGIVIRIRFSSLNGILGPPSADWIWGNMREIVSSPPGSAHVKWGNKYGNVVRFHGLFGSTRLLIMDPVALHYILVSNCYDYPKPADLRGNLKSILGNGILFAEGMFRFIGVSG
ncbi:hypothetical protein BT69DRAFT_1302286 [Atractiella rhizophila]|nr:hypothetical protein BT69DRAFT_1302286 [Atractiella rhizophila]